MTANIYEKKQLTTKPKGGADAFIRNDADAPPFAEIKNRDAEILAHREMEISEEMIEAGARLICERFYDVVSRESYLVRGLEAAAYLAVRRYSRERN